MIKSTGRLNHAWPRSGLSPIRLVAPPVFRPNHKREQKPWLYRLPFPTELFVAFKQLLPHTLSLRPRVPPQ